MPFVDVEYRSVLPAGALWEALVDIEEYPKYMEDVREVTILELEAGRRVSRWVTRLKGSIMTWTEEELIDDERRRLDFTQTEGDLALYTGHWQVTALKEGSLVEMKVEFDIGIPELGDMLDAIAAEAIRENMRSILGHIENRMGPAPAASGAGETG